MGDCWVGLSQAEDSGLILSARVGKHTDALIEELVVSTEGKQTARNGILMGGVDMSGCCHRKLNIILAHSAPSGWSGRTAFCGSKQDDGIAPQNKFGKQWEQTKVTTRLVVSYFNWTWEHSRLGTTAAQRAGLASESWSWHAFATFPTLA